MYNGLSRSSSMPSRNPNNKSQSTCLSMCFSGGFFPFKAPSTTTCNRKLTAGAESGGQARIALVETVPLQVEHNPKVPTQHPLSRVCWCFLVTLHSYKSCTLSFF